MSGGETADYFFFARNAVLRAGGFTSCSGDVCGRGFAHTSTLRLKVYIDCEESTEPSVRVHMHDVLGSVCVCVCVCVYGCAHAKQP